MFLVPTIAARPAITDGNAPKRSIMESRVLTREVPISTRFFRKSESRTVLDRDWNAASNCCNFASKLSIHFFCSCIAEPSELSAADRALSTCPDWNDFINAAILLPRCFVKFKDIRNISLINCYAILSITLNLTKLSNKIISISSKSQNILYPVFSCFILHNNLSFMFPQRPDYFFISTIMCWEWPFRLSFAYNLQTPILLDANNNLYNIIWA